MKDFHSTIALHPDYAAHLEKDITGRMRYLFASNALMEVMKTFGYRAFHRSSVLQGFEEMILKSNIGGDVAFEIGTAHGLTAVILSKYFGHVYSIDIASSDLKQKIVEHLGIHNITFLTVNSNSAKVERSKQINFDFAYVDGDHARDTYLDWRITKHCGRVLFQEYWEAQPDVWQLVNELPQEEVTTGGLNFAYWHRRGKHAGGTD